MLLFIILFIVVLLWTSLVDLFRHHKAILFFFYVLLGELPLRALVCDYSKKRLQSSVINLCDPEK